jgi:hypothetical protein
VMAFAVERGGDGDLVISDLEENKLGHGYLWRKRHGGQKFGCQVWESGVGGGLKMESRARSFHRQHIWNLLELLNGSGLVFLAYLVFLTN